MKFKSSSKRGFTLVEIAIICSVVGMLAAIAVPNFVRARHNSQTSTCINNLRQIEAATQTWAMERNKNGNSPVSETDVTPYLKSQALCPAGGTSFDNSYQLTTVSNGPACKKVAREHLIGF